MSGKKYNSTGRCEPKRHYMLLFSGDQITFNKLNPVIDIASMFGFVKNLDGKVVVSNRIFETILYNFFTEVSSSIYKAGVADKNK